MGNKTIKAFSLVEILVALIIMSVITAALVPVITKKLSSSGITIVGGGSQGNSNIEFERDCSTFGSECVLCFSDRCALCTKICPEGEFADVQSCTCKSCNVFGDSCTTCESRECKMCQEGYYINGGHCAICPIGSICNGNNKVACPDGQYTDLEGQTICKECEAGYSCKNGIKNACSAGTYSIQSSSTCEICPAGHSCPGSSDKILCSENGYQDEEGQASCKTCPEGYYVSDDKTACNVCLAGHYCTGNGTKTQCPKGAYSSQGAVECIKCPVGTYSDTPGATDLTTCKNCSTGTYSDSQGADSCSLCSSKTANCSKCDATTGVCSACASGYKLDGTSCVERTCPSLTMRIKLGDYYYCITQYNIGDQSVFPIPSTVTTVTAGRSKRCNSSTTKCCWKGTTCSNSSACDAANGGYSGCNRTVCNWNAANDACSKLTYGGLTWSLPHHNLFYYLYKLDSTTYSRGKGTTGLMFCDHYGNSSAKCPCGYWNCLGCVHIGGISDPEGKETSSYCQMPYIWANEYDSAKAYYGLFQNGKMYAQGPDNKGGALSVRCSAQI